MAAAFRFRLLGAGIVLAVAFGAVASTAAQPEPTRTGTPAAAAPEPSADTTTVEALMFEADHLAGIKPPARLEYRFSWDGKEPFDDRIVLAVSAKDGLTVEPDYLSGARHVDFPAVSQAHGNPLLLYFLEHDLREMQRETHGQANYFRRLIRRALAQPGLRVEPVDIEVGGRRLAASRIVVMPFHADPLAPSRYPRLKDKSYEFVFSDAVPGRIARLATRIAPPDGPAQTARVEWTGPAGPVTRRTRTNQGEGT